MKKLFTWLAITCSALISYNCIKDVDELNVSDRDLKKLVIWGFISPEDTLIRIGVYQTLPFFNNSDNHDFDLTGKYVQDATVELSDGQQSVLLRYNKYMYDGEHALQSSLYTAPSASFPIHPGKTYYLKVSTPDGRGVTSQCTVPETRFTFNDFAYKGMTINDTGNFFLQAYNYEMTWNKPDDFCASFYVVQDTEIWQSFYNGSTMDSILRVYSFTERKTDTLPGSTSLAVAFNSRENYYNTSYSRYRPLKLSVTSLDPFSCAYIKNFPERVKDPLTSYDTSAFPSSFDFTFQQPVEYYTNIQGGLGIFGAYRKAEVELGYVSEKSLELKGVK